MAVTTAPDIVYASIPIVRKEYGPDGTLYVYGRATTPAVDTDDQIVDSDFSGKALSDWLATAPTLRVQHNPQRDPAGSGVMVEVNKDGDGAHWVKGAVDEPVAKLLVEKGHLRAFSVGIANPTIKRDMTGKARGGIVAGGRIVEVSLVDSPANRGCFLQMVKAADGSGAAEFTGKMFGTPPDGAPMPLVVKADDADGDQGESDGQVGPAAADSADHDDDHRGDEADEAAEGQDFATTEAEAEPDNDTSNDSESGDRRAYKAACAQHTATEPTYDPAGMASNGTAVLAKQAARQAWQRWSVKGEELGLDGTDAGYTTWLAKRDFDPGVGGGVDRDQLPAEDFVDPQGRRFPIHTPKDVTDAAGLQGRADPPVPNFRARLTALAHRKGPAFVAALPASWGDSGDEPDTETAAKNITLTSPNPDGLVPYNLAGQDDAAPRRRRRQRPRPVPDADHTDVAEPDLTKAGVCPSCGEAVDGGKRCPACGAKLPKMLRKGVRGPGQRYTHGWKPIRGGIHAMETQHGANALSAGQRMHSEGTPAHEVAAHFHRAAQELERSGVPDREGIVSPGLTNRRKARRRDVERLRRHAVLHAQDSDTEVGKTLLADLVKRPSYPGQKWKHGWIWLGDGPNPRTHGGDAEHHRGVAGQMVRHHRAMARSQFEEAAQHLTQAASRAADMAPGGQRDSAIDRITQMRRELIQGAQASPRTRVGPKGKAFHETMAQAYEHLREGRGEDAMAAMQTATLHMNPDAPRTRTGRPAPPPKEPKPLKGELGRDHWDNRPRSAWMTQARDRQRQGMAAPPRGARADELARLIGQHDIQHAMRQSYALNPHGHHGDRYTDPSGYRRELSEIEQEREIAQRLAVFRAAHDERVRMAGLSDARGLRREDHSEMLDRMARNRDDRLDGLSWEERNSLLQDQAAEEIANDRNLRAQGQIPEYDVSRANSSRIRMERLEKDLETAKTELARIRVRAGRGPSKRHQELTDRIARLEDALARVRQEHEAIPANARSKAIERRIRTAERLASDNEGGGRQHYEREAERLRAQLEQTQPPPSAAADGEPKKRNSPLLGQPRADMARRLVRGYATGQSIAQLAAEVGYSEGFVHRMLTESGMQLRPRGKPARRHRPDTIKNAGGNPMGKKARPGYPHREPDGPDVEALETDAGYPHHHDDNEVIKSSGYTVARMHDALCPAYPWQAVVDAYPSLKSLSDAIDPSWFDLQIVGKAAAAGDTEAIMLGAVLQANAEALKYGVAPELAADARADLHKDFGRLNTGDIGGHQITPDQFRRPYITAGHAPLNAPANRPALIPPATHVIDPDDFHRGLITEGHQAASPSSKADNLDTGGSVATGASRTYYPNASRAATKATMAALHDHIVATLPGMCPMAPTPLPMNPGMGARNRPTPVAAPLIAAIGPGALTKAETRKMIAKAVTKATARYEETIAAMQAEIDQLSSMPDPTQAPVRGAVQVNKAATLNETGTVPVERGPSSMVEKAQAALAAERAQQIDFARRMTQSPNPGQREQAQQWLDLLLAETGAAATS